MKAAQAAAFINEHPSRNLVSPVAESVARMLSSGKRWVVSRGYPAEVSGWKIRTGSDHSMATDTEVIALAKTLGWQEEE